MCLPKSFLAWLLTIRCLLHCSPGGLWLANSPFCDVWDAYCTVLNERPLFTKIMTGMLGTFLGDLLAQCLANLPKEQGSRGAHQDGGFHYDAPRTLRLLAYSALVGTPVAHWWFGVLDAVSRGLRAGLLVLHPLGSL
jgi:hypothetical protein